MSQHCRRVGRRACSCKGRWQRNSTHAAASQSAALQAPLPGAALPADSGSASVRFAPPALSSKKVTAAGETVAANTGATCCQRRRNNFGEGEC